MQVSGMMATLFAALGVPRTTDMQSSMAMGVKANRKWNQMRRAAERGTTDVALRNYPPYAAQNGSKREAMRRRSQALVRTHEVDVVMFRHKTVVEDPDGFLSKGRMRRLRRRAAAYGPNPSVEDGKTMIVRTSSDLI